MRLPTTTLYRFTKQANIGPYIGVFNETYMPLKEGERRFSQCGDLGHRRTQGTEVNRNKCTIHNILHFR